MAGLSQDNLFRDVYSPERVRWLADRLAAHGPDFPRDRFVALAADGLEDLTMNRRIDQIADALEQTLPADFPTAVALVREAVRPEHFQTEPGSTNWTGFITVPVNAWVVRCGGEHLDLALDALHQLTRCLSAENHLRELIEVDPEHTLATLERWTADPDVHVRRLVSEGTRPRLPMTGRIQRFVDDPSPAIALLDRLRDDPELYVRRSVANHVNDISKDHPELALDTLERWAAAPSEHTDWLVRHALRTLLKAGHPRAFALLGYAPEPAVDAAVEVLTDPVPTGGELRFQATLRSTADRPQRLVLDYVVHFVKANGKPRPKVFKWTERTLEPGESLTLERAQHFRPTSGRTVYPGPHAVGLQINGVAHPTVGFDVVGDPARR